jgi:hypothetical protein
MAHLRLTGVHDSFLVRDCQEDEVPTCSLSALVVAALEVSRTDGAPECRSTVLISGELYGMPRRAIIAPRVMVTGTPVAHSG